MLTYMEGVSMKYVFLFSIIPQLVHHAYALAVIAPVNPLVVKELHNREFFHGDIA